MDEKIKRLLYLRKELDTVIDNTITEYLLRNELDIEYLRDSLSYRIDDNLSAFKRNC